MKLTGFTFALITALIWGTGPLFAKLGVTSAPISGSNAVIVRFTGALLFFLLFMLITGGSNHWGGILELPGKTIGYLFIEGILGAFLGQFTYYQSQKLWEASRVAAVAATFPLVTLILALLFLGEKLTVVKGAGIGLIVLGVAVLGLG